MKRVLVIHGPNVNLTGKREKEVYGEITFEEINNMIKREAAKLDIAVKIQQSNSEGEIINLIHSAENNFDAIIINPAAYTHYSLAIMDAIASVSVPVIEVHISNIFGREEFRRVSVTASRCKGVITGFGPYSYILALYAVKFLEDSIGG
ncbi:MAG: 3-dehydroquinate dehydratase [Caldanaerobacter subterraneus]|uniref:3-dehydroquinate dehydratase n=2 Tax=Caldanaerobacter subterraneus TaxID=911092 RepID=A0A124FCU2_9THEO|nr:type II 3-dehydroquinate dehydratase [Caldanaerobacter subterraneus]ERM91680.1 3-dehydroquinate dehydratase [Caldanaerobacter subterraneus subsp. yonseiensis KB-1]KUK09714.1 MAG: 3-dehydroquinate dehydratase [Caldanaerobacter subterraneus]NNG66787.1 type II 3-dehydroquinate dehydratase [Caldanaerobacter subterraneus]HBT50143.1 type II 3-dehydroquinate dehydratase [Caldanaerobacter subterraneus]